MLRSVQAAVPRPAPRVDGTISVHHVPTGVDLLALDHVALSVADPEAMAAFLCDHVGMIRLTGEADVTVVGAGAGAAPITLVAAEGPRDAGALERVVLRVADVAKAVALLPAGTAVEGDLVEEAMFEGPEGLGLGFTMVAGGGIDYDLDHVLLRCSDPDELKVALAAAGCVPRGQALHVADKYMMLARSPAATARPLLQHLAVRVDSIDAVVAKARERGLELDAHESDDTFAIVLPGPEQIGLHFVKRTPGG